MNNLEMAAKKAIDFMKEYNLYDDFIKFNKAVDKKMEEGYSEDEAIKIISESWNPPIDEVIK